MFDVCNSLDVIIDTLCTWCISKNSLDIPDHQEDSDGDGRPDHLNHDDDGHGIPCHQDLLLSCLCHLFVLPSPIIRVCSATYLLGPCLLACITAWILRWDVSTILSSGLTELMDEYTRFSTACIWN